jgi:DNA-binding response OmpR family regulator
MRGVSPTGSRRGCETRAWRSTSRTTGATRSQRLPSTSPRILRAADIELDPLARVATRSGRQLDLSVNEFGVLEALMRAAPAPLSSEDLLERVWDEHADPFTKTVYVTVSRLRRKLGDPEIITNVARVGYRI